MGILNKTALPLMLVLALAGCGQQGKLYPLAPEATEQALTGTSIPAIAFGMAAYSDPGQAVPGGVAWHIFRFSNGSASVGPAGSEGELLVLTARVSAASGGSAIAVDVAPSAGANAQAFAKGMASKPAIASMFRTIASEHVDATLTHRDFSMDNIKSSMVLAVASMLPLLREQMKQSDAERERQGSTQADTPYDPRSTRHAEVPHDRVQGLNADAWR